MHNSRPQDRHLISTMHVRSRSVRLNSKKPCHLWDACFSKVEAHKVTTTTASCYWKFLSNVQAYRLAHRSTDAVIETWEACLCRNTIGEQWREDRQEKTCPNGAHNYTSLVVSKVCLRVPSILALHEMTEAGHLKPLIMLSSHTTVCLLTHVTLTHCLLASRQHCSRGLLGYSPHAMHVCMVQGINMSTCTWYIVLYLL